MAAFFHGPSPAAMSTSAVRYVTGTKKNPLGLVYLQCHVKPGASKSREGVTALTDEAVEVCIAAQAQDGEANKATLALLSKVGSLGSPVSNTLAVIARVPVPAQSHPFAGTRPAQVRLAHCARHEVKGQDHRCRGHVPRVQPRRPCRCRSGASSTGSREHEMISILCRRVQQAHLLVVLVRSTE